MSREIKFRAWDENNKQMLYTNSEQTVWCGGKETSVNSDSGKYNGRFQAMQFTGLKDKTGKEIYEGDIVARQKMIGSSSNGREYMKVEWMVNTLRNGWNVCLPVKHKMMWEVSGNIYENPNLLK